MPGSLGPLLGLLYQAWVARRHEELAAAGYPDIRPAHGLVFRDLPPEGARVTVLAARTGVTKQQMSLLADELVGLGYLERIPDPTDGRARIVRLTDRGEQAFVAVRAINVRLEQDWASRFNADRLRRVRADLEDLIRALDLAL
jgi:DNA-binding MarR family transcriptional regulator